MFRKYFLTLICIAWLISACSQPASESTLTPAVESSTLPADTGELTVMVHDSFAISEGVIAEFESQNNLKVQFVKAGDAGTTLNKAILSKDNPLGDVLYGVDNTFLSRALEEAIFESYTPPVLASIDKTFKLDPENRALPVDYGHVCLNYDKSYFEEKSIPPPGSLEDLLKPEYKGLLVVENPATSSPGLAFLLTTIGHFGEDGYRAYWEGLVQNDVKVVNDWESAYYTEFSGSSGNGPRPVVVSYDSSPVFEVLYAETPIDESPTAAVVSDGSCYRQIEFVGILKGAKNRPAAEKWIDFMLSPAFQEDMAPNMGVYPVIPDAKLEDTFAKHLVAPEVTVSLDPDQITEKREQWINDWIETVLR
jgi:thiamine transport system substrate-binding protein